MKPGDLARAFYAKGGKVEWYEDGSICMELVEEGGGDAFWVGEPRNPMDDRVSDYVADCLVERAMREQMDGAWPQYSDAAIAEMMMDPDALLQAWEEVCCDT